MSIDVQQVLENIHNQLAMEGGTYAAFCAILYAAALITVGSGAYHLAKAKEEGSRGTGVGITLILLAGLLGAFPGFINSCSETLFNYHIDGNPLSSANNVAGGDANIKAALKAGMTIIKVVGLFAMWRALMRMKIWALTDRNPKLVSEASVLAISGTCCVYLPQFIGMICNTLGGGLPQIVNQYITWG